MKGNTVKVFDDSNKILKNGELGEIRIKGDNVFSKYINDNLSTKKDLKMDGSVLVTLVILISTTTFI